MIGVRGGLPVALLGAFLAMPAGAAAGPAADKPSGILEGTVALSRGGDKLADAAGVVVYVIGFTEPAPQTVGKIEQKDRTFTPDLLPITVGQKVSFPNRDPVLHNVFSPSATRPFDLGQFKRGQSKAKDFTRTGVVDVYCNIHPEMSATILILPNRRFARTDASGAFHIEGVPVGTWKVYAYSRRADRPVAAKVSIRAGKTAKVALALDESRADFDHKNKYGETYRDPGRYR